MSGSRESTWSRLGTAAHCSSAMRAARPTFRTRPTCPPAAFRSGSGPGCASARVRIPSKPIVSSDRQLIRNPSIRYVVWRRDLQELDARRDACIAETEDVVGVPGAADEDRQLVAGDGAGGVL